MPVTGLRRQRLDRPYVRVERQAQAGHLGRSLRRHRRACAATTPDSMAAIVGDLAAAEEIKALKDLMTALGVDNLDCRQDGAQDRVRPAPDLSVQHHHRRRRSGRRHPAGRRQSALGSAGAECPHPQDLAGTAISRSPILGPAVDLTYPVEQLGADIASLEAIAEWQPRFREGAEGRQAADDHSGPGRAGARATARRSSAGGEDRRATPA